MTAPQPSPRATTHICDPDRVLCPRCGTPVTRVRTGTGHAWARCDGSSRRQGPHGLRHEKCGQHLYIATLEGGTPARPRQIALPIAISREEFDYMTAREPESQAAALELLGILRALDAREVSLVTCSSCHEPTKAFHTYGGICRWCRSGDARPGPYYLPARP